MKWAEVCRDPSLQDLPYKIELNGWGQIVMSPTSNKHGRYRSKIGIFFAKLVFSGEGIAFCSIQTNEGVKVADVAWASDRFIRKHGFKTPYIVAPEVCVEIISPSNSPAVIHEKVGLYLEAGAKEVWVCDDDGQLSFFTAKGSIVKSALVPKFLRKL